MSNYELFKATYMQNPFTLLTEENLDKLEEHCKKSIHFERGIEHKVTLELLDRYRELESEKAKLIEKLEKILKRIMNLSFYHYKLKKHITTIINWE